MSNPNHFKVKRLLSGNRRYPKSAVFTARWFRGETGGFLEVKRPDRSYESWQPYKDWKRYFELVGSVDPSVPCVTPEVSTETLTETKENTMLKIVDCIEINGNKVSRMTVDDLIGYLKLERENLATLRDDLGETRSLLKNIEKLTAPYINNIARLTALLDEKAGAL